MGVYKFPCVVRCEAMFKDANGALATPVVTQFVLRKPNGVVVVYTTPDPAIVIDSTGAVHVDVVADSMGDHLWTFKHNFGGVVLFSNPEKTFRIDRPSL